MQRPDKSHPSHPSMISLTQMLSAMRSSLGHGSFLDGKDLLSKDTEKQPFPRAYLIKDM